MIFKTFSYLDLTNRSAESAERSRPSLARSFVSSIFSLANLALARIGLIKCSFIVSPNPLMKDWLGFYSTGPTKLIRPQSFWQIIFQLVYLVVKLVKFRSSRRRKMIMAYYAADLIFFVIIRSLLRHGCVVLIGSTAGAPGLNCLCAAVREKNGSVIGFDHGGERLFFKDDWYWRAELKYKDKYITFTRLHSKYLRRVAECQRSSVEIEFLGVAPLQKDRINSTRRAKNLQSWVYLARAIGDGKRHVFARKPTEDRYFRMVEELCRLIRINTGAQVALKVHPKGQRAWGDRYTYVGWDELHQDPQSWVVVCDYFGSGALQCIADGFELRYLYLESERPLSNFGKRVLNGVICDLADVSSSKGPSGTSRLLRSLAWQTQR